MRSSLSLSQARRLALAAQGLARPRPDTATGWPALAKAIRPMRLLQIDSVNVLCRSHYLPVFARAGHYDTVTLDARTHGGKKRAFFEYWAHEASFLPLEYWPLFQWKMARAKSGRGKYRDVHDFAKRERTFVDRVLDEVRRRGPLAVSDLEDPGGRSGQWWGWSKGKFALELLFDRGDVTAAKRDGFERIYDLPERVLPADILNSPAVPEADAIRGLLDRSGAALGVATEFDLRDYFRLPVEETKRGIVELVESKRLLPVVVEGWKQPAFLHCEAKSSRRTEARALVSPFDPICWDRDRTERLFDFRYRIEIYTPKPKRIFGYYVLPFLDGDRFTARVCLKADRQAGVLRANATHLEQGADRGRTAAALAAELTRMAAWLGLGDVAVGPEGDLSKSLRSAIG